MARLFLRRLKYTLFYLGKGQQPNVSSSVMLKKNVSSSIKDLQKSFLQLQVATHPCGSNTHA